MCSLLRFFRKNPSPRHRPPKIVGWELLPSLCVCIFGPIKSVPEITNIEKAERQYVRHYFASDNSDDLSDEYERLLNKKYQLLCIPHESELGLIDKPSRIAENLWSITGEVLLLLEPGSIISENDGQKILNVLSEFFIEPRLMLLQGKGYHAFVRTKALTEYEFCRKGRLRDHCKRFGFSWKRVDYISINPIKNRDYEW